MLHQPLSPYRILYRWLIIGCLCASLLTFAPAQAASIKLSGAEVATGLFQISPDSRYVVYVAKANPSDRFENLYSVSLRGGMPVSLTQAPPVEPIVAYGISPDGSQVIYQHGTDLYRVPMVGPASASVKLNIMAMTPASGQQFLLSAGGLAVVYRASNALYSVPVEGPADLSIKLNIADLQPAASGLRRNEVHAFAISPDSQRVIYVARADSTAFGLYSVSLTGPASDSVLLSTPSPGTDITWVTCNVSFELLLLASKT